VIDIRTEIRAAFETEQSAFPPHAALRAQVVAELSLRGGADAPARQRVERNVDWLMVAAAALLTIAIVAGLLLGRLMSWYPTLVKPGPAPGLCAPVKTPPLHGFDLLHGYITYAYGSDVWAVDPSQSTNRVSLGPANGLAPVSWSRDGTHLLLSDHGISESGGPRRDLYVMNADGSQTRLTCDGQSLGEGSFSPDGAQVVFARQDLSLYVVDATGGTPRLIVDSRTSGQAGSAAWSPDGSRIAYAKYLETGPKGPAFEIWTVNPDGSDARLLVDLGTCAGGFCTGGLAWSPDGSTLAFHSSRSALFGTQTKAQIYTVRADGSGLRRINDDGGQPSWSPDGSRIAFLRSNDFADVSLSTMARDGSDVRPVDSVAIAPTSGSVWNPVANSRLRALSLR
jgi:Tol biopolymer transport system component